MKILQLIQRNQLRGAETFAYTIGKRLNDLGNQSTLISIFRNRKSKDLIPDVINLNRSLKCRFFDIYGWYLLHKKIGKQSFDVIQANAGDTLKFAVSSKILFRWKTPIVFRNASTVSLYIKSPFIKWYNKLLFKKVHHVVSVSEHSKIDFIKIFPEMEQKISVIPIGINLSKSNNHINRSNNVILHVGGFTFEKNHEGLLNIYESLKKNNSDLKLWLIGDGPLRNEIENIVKEKEITDVKFFGYQTDVSLYMQQVSVLVLPSIIEGLPAVILEAMHCKTPVVAYNVGGISEVVINNRTGWLIEKNNEEAFVEAVKVVLKSDNTIITQQAYDLVTTEYNNEVIAKRFEKLYQEVSNESNS
ncbi:MAG: glycosyltransferase [Cyclobacteriaceae bacterium]|jgi:glycosyltransferase involved in cell wall biosynthesis|nr:glycosyltransferase [Cytophagales bacterium]MCZ8327599.1 glycosyltransferase [Cyclobacteriaceae bacterium]